MDLDTIVEKMKALGVTRVTFHADGTVASIEMGPPTYELLADEPDTSPAKDAGACIVPECTDIANYKFAPGYCRKHGRMAMGLK